jgi:H+-transporting ATPase
VDYYDKQDMSKHPEVEQYPAFFHMPVLMLMLITLLNDGTLISIGYDTVNASPLPQRWNLPVLFTVAGALGFVALVSSLLILHVGLDSWNPNGYFQAITGLRIGLHYGQITTMMYLKVSISDFLTLFSARTLDGPFWSSRPSPVLLGAAFTALSISTALSILWPAEYPDGIETEGMGLHKPHRLAALVWAYCVACWFVQDAFKLLVVATLTKFNVFGINDSVCEAMEKEELKSGHKAAALTTGAKKGYQAV